MEVSRVVGKAGSWALGNVLVLGGHRKIPCTAKGEKAGKGDSRSLKESVTRHMGGELVVDWMTIFSGIIPCSFVYQFFVLPDLQWKGIFCIAYVTQKSSCFHVYHHSMCNSLELWACLKKSRCVPFIWCPSVSKYGTCHAGTFRYFCNI